MKSSLDEKFDQILRIGLRILKNSERLRGIHFVHHRIVAMMTGFAALVFRRNREVRRSFGEASGQNATQIDGPLSAFGL